MLRVTLLYTLSVLLWSTVVWYPLLMSVLYRFGIGPRTRRGNLRRINMIDLMNAGGCGIFFGNLVFVIARVST